MNIALLIINLICFMVSSSAGVALCFKFDIFFCMSDWKTICLFMVCVSAILITNVICSTSLLSTLIRVVTKSQRCNSYDDALKDMLTKESKSDKGGDGAKKEQEGEKKEE